MHAPISAQQQQRGSSCRTSQIPVRQPPCSSSRCTPPLCSAPCTPSPRAAAPPPHTQGLSTPQRSPWPRKAGPHPLQPKAGQPADISVTTRESPTPPVFTPPPPFLPNHARTPRAAGVVQQLHKCPGLGSCGCAASKLLELPRRPLRDFLAEAANECCCARNCVCPACPHVLTSRPQR